MKVLKNSQGLALFMVIFVMAFFMVFVTGGLIISGFELKKANNLQLATQALEAADAGLQHGLTVIPWVWDFNSQLNCGSASCPLVPATHFPAGSALTYTVTVKNDPGEALPNTDTNSRVVVTSEANGANGTKKVVEAYIKRSVGRFTPPAAVYVNASTSSPVADSSNSSAAGYFDIDNNIRIIGNDINTDGSSGPQPALPAIATTDSAVENALRDEYKTVEQFHDVCNGCNSSGQEVTPGAKVEPSISTVSDVLDIDAIAGKLFNAPGAVKYLNGIVTDGSNCASSNPCKLGTSGNPQITYIKETYDTDMTVLQGSVVGYGVIVFEGHPIIGGDFQFYGLVVHKRPNANSYISLEDNAKVFGGVLLGSYDEDGGGPQKPKARFGFKDNVRLYYSSQTLATVDTNWGSLLPKPARVFAWLDK